MRHRTLGLCVMLALNALTVSAWAAAYQPKPLPADSKRPTAREVNRGYYEYLRRNMVKAYERVGSRDPRWEAEAARYLEKQASFLAQWNDHSSTDALVKDGKALLELGCADPLVLYCYGSALNQAKQWNAARDVLGRSVDGFDKIAYPRVIARAAPLLLGEIFSHERDRPAAAAEMDRLREVAAKWTGDAAGEMGKGEERDFLRAICSTGWNGLFKGKWRRVFEALSGNPKADPYVVSFLEGVTNLEEAWEQRGGGWAGTVTEEGWKGFAEHLAAARGPLTRAWEMRPDLPEAPTEMIKVAAVAGVEENEERKWFDRAVAAQCDYPFAYSVLRNYLRPRWGGSHEEMYRFGLDCARTRRYDTDVPEQFLYVLMDISDDLDDDPAWWRRPDVYPILKEIFTQYAKSADREELRRDNLSLLAACAWRCGHYDDARKLLEELGAETYADNFQRTFRVSRAQAKEEIHAFTGPLGAEARGAERLREAGKAAAAAAAYEKLFPRLEDPLAIRYVKARLAVLSLEGRFASGQWVDLVPREDLLGWSKRTGDWKVDPDGTIRGTSQTEGPWLLCDADFGDQLELRGEVEFPPSEAKWVGCAIYFRWLRRVSPDYLTFRLLKTGKEAILSHDNSDRERSERDVEVKDRNTFRLRLSGTTVTTYLNGAMVHKAVTLEQDAEDEPMRIGFGQGYGSPGSLVLRHLQIRRLPHASKGKARAKGKTR